MKRIILAALVLACAMASTAAAQQTTGTITGRIVDAQGSAVPGVTVTGKNTQTGFVRSDVSDGEGVYRLTALPVGTYDLTAELQGFSRYESKGLVLNVGQTMSLEVPMKVATLSETVTVTGETPLIETTSSSVGGVVDLGRVENLPLNGRQFANLAATIPGVGLGFHSDPTKSTQYSPQIGGGNGRNLNYQIDGGDNNDDTVGGLLQLFPLEAIQEFNFVTSRYKAEYGRSNGGVMNIVTKSGTNNMAGSFFTLYRDDQMNAKTETETLNDADKQDYKRYQFGGSFGGPIVQDRIHYFAAAERTQQDTFQVVSTLGLFPELDGTFGTPYRENLVTGKVTANLNAAQYLAVRYGRNTNSQPYGAGPLTPPNGWGTSKNNFNSINLNHNWVLGGSKLNEFIFQYADFANFISANSQDPYELFQNDVAVGQSPNTPQTTEQKKYQFKNDFSWSVSGLGGLGHEFKTGVNFINEPRLFITFNSGKGVVQYTHLNNDRNGPISVVQLNDGDASANIPLKQYAAYIQDDWRVSDKMTVNLGLRYDYITGYQFDQSKNANFVKLQAAGRAGLLAGIKGLENFGQDPENDKDNWQPRVGVAYDVRGNGRDVIRGGYGIYYDMAYTNSNALFAASDATGVGFGTVLNVDDQAGIRNPDGSFYRVGQPLSNIRSQNQADTSTIPVFGQFTDPLLELPYTRQASLGWSHQLMESTVFTADFVRNDGRDLNTRPRINTRPVGNLAGARRIAFTGISPDAPGTRPAVSRGKSKYTALILGLKRRMLNGFDFSATYTLSEAKSTMGNAADELNQNNLQDATLLYDDPRVFGPTGRTDARHQGSVATIVRVKGFTIAPIFLFRSALPVSIIEGLDTNRNGERNDLPAMAYAFDGVGNAPKEIGNCETWNCGRGASRTQMNLRLSRSFRLYGNARVEAIGEVFNLLNAKNPAGFTGGRASRLLVGGGPNPDFLQPSEYSGDFQNPEQRVGQIGFRFTF
ncbi:MAG: TonB-dependent receptor [Acidobacteria bacterium]|nr:TonB-dependent receptor [Acidobacteriota bacterium]